MSEPITQPVNTLPVESSPVSADAVLTVKDTDGSLVRVALSAIKSLFGVPSASDVGAIAAPSSPATGAFLVWNGSAWVAQTLSTWQGGSF